MALELSLPACRRVRAAPADFERSKNNKITQTFTRPDKQLRQNRHFVSDRQTFRVRQTCRLIAARCSAVNEFDACAAAAIKIIIARFMLLYYLLECQREEIHERVKQWKVETECALASEFFDGCQRKSGITKRGDAFAELVQVTRPTKGDPTHLRRGVAAD
jgi:hypothetical protein